MSSSSDEDGLIERPSEAAVPTYSMFTRPEGLSPISDIPADYDIRKLHGRKGTLFTSTGVFDVTDPDNQAGFPADLRTPATHPGRGAGLRPNDLNYAILSKKGRDRAGEIETRIGELGGKVVGMVRDGYVIWATPAVANEFRHSDDFLAFSPLPRAHRFHKGVGRTQLLEKARAESRDMRLRVTVVPGVEDPEQVERQLAAHAKSVRPAPSHLGRDYYDVEADRSQAIRIAGKPWVLAIHERIELISTALEAIPVLQVGSWEDREFETPFWDAGLDGTGQIVGLADNGLSYDQPAFSHTAVVPGTLEIALGIHRKIRQYVTHGDGESCDSTSSGGGTHGNVVGGLIAGNASDLGFFAQFQPNRTELLTGLNLDGLARNARIAFQDIGTAGQCTLNELVEVGGTVTLPGGSITQVMTDALSVGGKIHALPFAVPSFDSLQFANCVDQPCNPGDPEFDRIEQAGQYTAESEEVDTFLAANLDYMAFLPTGNNGGVYPRALGRITDLVPDGADGDFCNDNVDNTLEPYASAGCPAAIGTPSAPTPPMIGAPATAKGDVTVGSSRSDLSTEFGTFNAEDVVSNFTSKGPESQISLRGGPTIVAVGMDDYDVFGAPNTIGITVFGSRDNDQSPPVQTDPLILDVSNAGSSYAVGSAAGVGAIVRQYFEDGYYPSGSTVPANAAGNLSGALVKAMMLQMTNYMDFTLGGGAQNANANDTLVAANRCGTLIGTDSLGNPIGVVGNFEQGCGRPIMAQWWKPGNRL